LQPSLDRRLAAEAAGSALLLAAIVGSGIMAERLAGGDVALALLCNAIATGAALCVLILIFAPLSGAHLNPLVSIAAAMRGEVGAIDAASYVVTQIAGAVLGVVVAHLMFELPPMQLSATERGGFGQLLAEAVASLGLLLAIFGTQARTPAATPYAVGLYIAAAYWFTSSTSFANPAVTIARALTATFSGIRPGDALGFVLAQGIGLLAALVFIGWLWPKRAPAPPAAPPPRVP
jgi:glycerol uptake facilitator-like aquaporin